MVHITTLGSLYYDCIAQTSSLPRAGDEVRAESLSFRLGGSGGMMAAAARRQGASVSALGSVGDDSAGGEYLSYLQALDVNTEGVKTQLTSPTGMALITKDARGDVMIVTGAGANDLLKAETVDDFRPFIARAAIFLTHLGMPLEITLAALRLAPMMGTQTCLRAAPWRGDFPWGEVALDFVIINAASSRELLGRHVLHLGEAGFVEQKLRSLGIQTLIMTRGADTTLIFTQSAGCHEVPTLSARPVDSSGAGDCFAGAFAAHWAEHRDTLRAAKAAS